MENSIPKKIASPKKFKGWQILTASVYFWKLSNRNVAEKLHLLTL